MATLTKKESVTMWGLSVLLAALFLFASATKLIGVPSVVEGFRHWGFPTWSRFVIGGIELVGAVGLLIPRYAAEAASFLIMVMVGALFTLLHARENFLLPLVVMVLLGAVTWLRSEE
jgi:putative oxidoreductase